MNEEDFWSHLEFRLCREFRGMSVDGLSLLWCDGIRGEAFLFDDPLPRVIGFAWICRGDQQERWRMELLLPPTMKSYELINWDELLPAENVTRWIACDRSRKYLQIEPAAAVPDLD
jgi:hypothetical protein